MHGQGSDRPGCPEGGFALTGGIQRVSALAFSWWQQVVMLVAGHGVIVAEFFGIEESRTVPWARRPQAAALVAQLADPAAGGLVRTTQSRESLSVILTATVLGVLGRIEARHGREAESVEQLDQSQALLAEVDDGGLAADERAQRMLTVALVHNFLGQIRLSQGDPGRATQQFREGLRAGRRTSDRVSILISLYDLAMSSQAGGELTEATGFLQEGLSVAAEAGDETSVAYYLESLAAVAGQQHNSLRAVRLLSAAAAMLQAKGSGWLHAYVPRAAYDDAVLAVLRSRLGDAAFAEAWAWGGSIGGRNAVDYALQTG